jgi:hypothetical protein
MSEPEATSSSLMQTLLCPVKPRRERLELTEELTGDVALQAALHLAHALALGQAPLDVSLRRFVLAHADEHDGVQGTVELAVPFLSG